MSTSTIDMTVAELVDGDDLEFLKTLAAQRGIELADLIKEAIQEVIARRTRPKAMKGKIQAFRR